MNLKKFGYLFAGLMLSLLPSGAAMTFPNINIGLQTANTPQDFTNGLQILIWLTILTLAPSIFILMTCFLRFSIVLDFIKRALSLQQVPPTAVLNGIAIFMTLFCMWPTFRQIYTDSFQPLSNNEITLTEAIEKAESPIRIFMFRQMGNDKNSIRTFMTMAGLGRPANASDVPTYVLIPAYILHELTVAFKIGILLYIPFTVIDMVVASVLMSMGMFMLPPTTIALPFKLILFVMVDGWHILVEQLIKGFM